MKRIALFAFLTVFAISSSIYAQDNSVRLGVSSVSYDNLARARDNINASFALGAQSYWCYLGTRVDFNRDSGYWSPIQLEVGPSFLRAGPGLVLDEQKKNGKRSLRVSLSATFNPWKGFYLNSRWAPVSLTNRPNSKNFLDAGLGWQFNF